jgi:hypothetical protein
MIDKPGQSMLLYPYIDCNWLHSLKKGDTMPVSMLKAYDKYPPTTPTIFSDETLRTYKFRKAYIDIQHYVMNDEEIELAHQLNDANHYVGPYAGNLIDLEPLICAEGFDIAFKYGYGEFIVRERTDDKFGKRIYPWSLTVDGDICN